MNKTLADDLVTVGSHFMRNKSGLRLFLLHRVIPLNFVELCWPLWQISFLRFNFLETILGCVLKFGDFLRGVIEKVAKNLWASWSNLVRFWMIFEWLLCFVGLVPFGLHSMALLLIETLWLMVTLRNMVGIKGWAVGACLSM